MGRTRQVKIEDLEQLYKNQLVKVGVDLHKAEQAAKNLTREELLLICEIWPEWAIAFSQMEELDSSDQTS